MKTPFSEFSRRGFLAAAAIAPWAGVLNRARADAAPGLITRVHHPANLEMNFSGLDSLITPTDLFYVRSHFQTPTIAPETWRLTVEGHVSKPMEFTLDDLMKLKSSTKPLTMECAGNGRVYLSPPVRGVNWQTGAVGNAEWTGVTLSQILAGAGVKRGAVEVLLEGTDGGAIPDATPGKIAYNRSLPLKKALAPETVLAYSMNGKPLTPAHGFPLRAVIGGWYGMASVKWLTRIVVLDRPYNGFFQSIDYTYYERINGQPSLTAITGMLIKSQIARPYADEVVPVGKPYRVFCAAWAGERDVAKVQISADGGKTWSDARLTGRAQPFCWRFWEWEWKPGKSGPASLMARATDSTGATQPMTRSPDFRTYMINHVVPTPVDVR